MQDKGFTIWQNIFRLQKGLPQEEIFFPATASRNTGNGLKSYFPLILQKESAIMSAM